MKLRRVAYLGVPLIGAYLLLCGLFYGWMRQPPGTFAARMGRLPMPLRYAAMMALPFEPMWLRARAGTLRPGDMAPDFSLPLLHADGAPARPDQPVRLSVYRGARPVVLIFGSYT